MLTMFQGTVLPAAQRALAGRRIACSSNSLHKVLLLHVAESSRVQYAPRVLLGVNAARTAVTAASSASSSDVDDANNNRKTTLLQDKANPETFSFTQANTEVAQEIISRYPPEYKRAAIMPLLHLAQEQEGFTSRAAMHEVARLTGAPRMRVYEVATFYTMYKRTPGGKNLISVCGTTPCRLRGAGNVINAISESLGLSHGASGKPGFGVTEDKLFELEEVECAGACVNAPVVAINGDYYEDVTPEQAKNLVEAIRRGEKLPKPGPLNGRRGCEPHGGETTLRTDPEKFGPGFRMRDDL